jgi:mycofactocin precursor
MPEVAAEEKVSSHADRSQAPETLVIGDLLVEDVSIDGMCGVY